MALETDAEWRGRIGATVDDHDRDIEALKKGLDRIRVEQVRTGTRVVRVKTEVEGLREDITDLKGELAKGLEGIGEQFTDLRKHVAASRVSGKDLLMFVVAPFFVAVLAALVVGLLTGHL